MNRILLIFVLVIVSFVFQNCTKQKSPAQLIESYYAAICNGEFEQLEPQLNLIPARKAIFDDYNKKVVDFFATQANQADKDVLAGLFEITEATEQIANDKKSATVKYTLKVNGEDTFNLEARFTKGEEGWQIFPGKGALDFRGYEDVLMYMPSLNNNLSDEELNIFQKETKKIDYLACVTEAAKRNLFDEMLTRFNRKQSGSCTEAVLVDADEFGRFKEGLCAFRRGKFWGFIDVNGKVVIEPKLNYPEYTFVDYDGKKINFPFFSYGLCLVFNNEGWPVYIDKKSNVVIDGSYRFMLAAPFVGNYANVGLAKLKPTHTYPLNEKRGYLTALNAFIDRNGQVEPNLGISEVLGAMEAMATLPHEGLSVFRNDQGLLGFWDINRKIVIPAQFSAVKMFSEGIAWVEKKDDYGRKKWGAIDKTGKTLIDFVYENTPEDFSCGRAAVKPKERNLAADFVDPDGNKIFSTQYNALFSDRKVFKLGLLGDMDCNGNTVMPKRTAHAFPINKLQLFAPDFDWKTADVDEIFYTDLKRGDVEIAALSWKYGTDFVYSNKRFFDYGQTEGEVLFEGFRGPGGNFKIIRYR